MKLFKMVVLPLLLGLILQTRYLTLLYKIEITTGVF